MLTTTRSAIFWLSREFTLALTIASLSLAMAPSCVSFSFRSNRVSSSSSRLRLPQSRFALMDQVLEVILGDLANQISRLDVIAELHVQRNQPTHRLGSHLGERVLIDQQDSLTIDLGGNLAEYRESKRRRTNSKQRGKTDPGMDRRHADQSIELVERIPEGVR